MATHLQKEEPGLASVPGGDVVHLSGNVDLLAGHVASAGDPCRQGDGTSLAAEAAQIFGLAAATRRLWTGGRAR